MKKFRFPLQPVATLRKMREADARESFAAAVHAYVASEETLARIAAHIVELEEIIAGERSARFRPADQAAFMQALAAEVARKTAAAATVAAAKVEMDTRRQAWVEARRDVRLLESLEGKARRAHAQEAEREQQALLDDRTNALFARAG